MADVEREAKVMRGLHHQNIVGFVETLIIKPFYCIVLEFVCGRDLKELTTIKMSNNTTWAEAEMKPILRGILDGLVYLHLQDIIHRDIKGANIMYSDDGVGFSTGWCICTCRTSFTVTLRAPILCTLMMAWDSRRAGVSAPAGHYSP